MSRRDPFGERAATPETTVRRVRVSCLTARPADNYPQEMRYTITLADGGVYEDVAPDRYFTRCGADWFLDALVLDTFILVIDPDPQDRVLISIPPDAVVTVERGRLVHRGAAGVG